jgi:hypothetical protein
MWYLSLLNPMIHQLPKTSQPEAQLFLKNFFAKVDALFLKQPAVAIQFYLSVAEKMYQICSNRPLLTKNEFIRSMVGLTLIYLKQPNSTTFDVDEFSGIFDDPKLQDDLDDLFMVRVNIIEKPESQNNLLRKYDGIVVSKNPLKAFYQGESVKFMTEKKVFLNLLFDFSTNITDVLDYPETCLTPIIPCARRIAVLQYMHDVKHQILSSIDYQTQNFLGLTLYALDTINPAVQYHYDYALLWDKSSKKLYFSRSEQKPEEIMLKENAVLVEKELLSLFKDKSSSVEISHHDAQKMLGQYTGYTLPVPKLMGAFQTAASKETIKKFICDAQSLKGKNKHLDDFLESLMLKWQDIRVQEEHQAQLQSQHQFQFFPHPLIRTSNTLTDSSVSDYFELEMDSDEADLGLG